MRYTLILGMVVAAALSACGGGTGGATEPTADALALDSAATNVVTVFKSPT